MSSEAPEVVPEDSAEELYDQAPCGYLSALPDGTIIRINETLLRWLGKARADVVRQKRLGDILTVGGRVFLETHLAPLLHMQGHVHEIALDLLRAGEAPLPVLMSAAMKRDDQGRPIMIRATLFNVTDRRKYERELVLARRQAEAATQAKSDFVSMISHEIRTPLSAIIGVGRLLERTALTPHQEQLTSLLRASADNLLGLINDILDFSKIEAGKISLEQRPLDLLALVEEVAATLRVKADEKGIALVTTSDPRVPSAVLGDPVKLRQVLMNLVSNAIQFTAMGSVTLFLVAEDVGPTPTATRRIRFEVRDTGIGIAADRLAQIFDDFTQASYDISVEYGGTGLGLAITRRLVELHGSKVFVESTAGAGSRFWFTLEMTAAEPHADAGRSSGDEDLAAVVRGLRVLLVDDNEVNQLVIGGFLDTWGVVHDSARNGREAVEMVAAKPYDLVLMDLRMPELTGYEATRAIRRMPEPRLRELPIIAVSASMRMGDHEDLQQAGFTDFVGKPVAPELLLRKLAEYAPKSASERR